MHPHLSLRSRGDHLLLWDPRNSLLALRYRYTNHLRWHLDVLMHLVLADLDISISCSEISMYPPLALRSPGILRLLWDLEELASCSDLDASTSCCQISRNSLLALRTRGSHILLWDLDSRTHLLIWDLEEFASLGDLDELTSCPQIAMHSPLALRSSQGVHLLLWDLEKSASCSKISMN